MSRDYYVLATHCGWRSTTDVRSCIMPYNSTQHTRTEQDVTRAIHENSLEQLQKISLRPRGFRGARIQAWSGLRCSSSSLNNNMNIFLGHFSLGLDHQVFQKINLFLRNLAATPVYPNPGPSHLRLPQLKVLKLARIFLKKKTPQISQKIL